MAKTGDRRVTAKKAATARQAVKAGKAQGPAATSRVAVTGGDEAASKPVRNYKTHTKKLIAKQFSGIMESMAVKSKEGSLAHAKFLFEIGGVKEELERQGRGKAEPSLADLLLAEVRRQHAANGLGTKALAQTGQETLPITDEDRDEGATD